MCANNKKPSNMCAQTNRNSVVSKNLRTKYQCLASLFDKEEKGWSFLDFAYLAISTNESQALWMFFTSLPRLFFDFEASSTRNCEFKVNRSISPQEIKKAGADRGYSELGFEQSWAQGIEDAKVYCVNALIFFVFWGSHTSFPTLLFLSNVSG